MKKLTKILAMLLLIALTATLFASPVFATEQGADTPETEEILKVYDKAEIMMAKGGASAIVSMTFDDDHMPTALTLNELFAEYGLKGSLMMRTDYMFSGADKTKTKWNEVFAKGYLEPQSHSATHVHLGSKYWEENNGAQAMLHEIIDSKNKLNTEFPSYDCLTFAVPNSDYNTPADELLTETYYAVRSGACPFDGTDVQTGFDVQSLDPVDGYGAGSWHNLTMARLSPSHNNTTLEENLEYLKTCVEEGGWYVSLTHFVYEEDAPYLENNGAASSNNDMTIAAARTFFSAVKGYVEKGEVWCTTFSEATKYVRERQNSTVSQYETASGIYVEVNMADTTSDNLPLPADVFNVPLTVKVQLPNGWKNVTVTQNGTSTAYPTFTDKGVTFAYIELVPNSGKAQLSNTGDYSDYIDSITIYQNLAIEEEIAYNLYFPNDGKIASIAVNDVILPALSTDKYENYNMYTLDNLFVTDVATEYTFIVTFAEETGMDSYVFNTSVLKYLSDVAESDSATVAEKQLCFDFATYTKDAFVKIMTDKDTPRSSINTAPYDDTLVKYAGYTLTEANLGAAANVGNLGEAFSGVSFSLNEKPYYLLHLEKGFYGDVEVTVGGNTQTYQVINGYYHCKSYIIIEVGALCDLLDDITVSAVGSIDDSGEPAINASGAYNVANYCETVNGGNAPDYAKSLAAYITSAKAYLDANAAQA